MFGEHWNDISNRADFIDVIEFLDRDADEPIDLTGCQDIVLQLVYPQLSDVNVIHPGSNYSSGYNYNGARVSLREGSIQHVQMGMIEFHFPAGIMNALPPQNYHMGLALVSADGIITQAIIGDVSVREGFVLAGVNAP